MRKAMKFSFYPIAQSIRQLIVMCDFSYHFTPNLFIDCVLMRFIEMYRGSRKDVPVSLLTHRELIIYLEEYGDSYAHDGNLDTEYLLDQISRYSEEVTTILNTIFNFLLNEASNGSLDLTEMVDFSHRGLIYVVVVEDGK